MVKLTKNVGRKPTHWASVNKLKAKPWFEDRCVEMLLALGPIPPKLESENGDDFWDSQYRADYVAHYLARGRWVNQAEEYLMKRHQFPLAYLSDMIVAFELWYLQEKDREQERDA